MFSTWVLKLHRLSPGRGKAGGWSSEQMMWAMVVFLLKLCALILAGWCWGLLLGHPGVSECAETWALLKTEQYWPIFLPETSNYCLHLPWLYFLIFFSSTLWSCALPWFSLSSILPGFWATRWNCCLFFPHVLFVTTECIPCKGKHGLLYSVMTGPLQL